MIFHRFRKPADFFSDSTAIPQLALNRVQEAGLRGQGCWILAEAELRFLAWWVVFPGQIRRMLSHVMQRPLAQIQATTWHVRLPAGCAGHGSGSCPSPGAPTARRAGSCLEPQPVADGIEDQRIGDLDKDHRAEVAEHGIGSGFDIDTSFLGAPVDDVTRNEREHLPEKIGVVTCWLGGGSVF